jgi:hypothetical protein
MRWTTWSARCGKQNDMHAREQLRVCVDADLSLDAGTREEVPGPQGPECLLRPPATTLFHRVTETSREVRLPLSPP